MRLSGPQRALLNKCYAFTPYRPTLREGVTAKRLVSSGLVLYAPDGSLLTTMSGRSEWAKTFLPRAENPTLLRNWGRT